MGLNKNYLAVYFFSIFGLVTLAQQGEEVVQDSVPVNTLDEVVVTGENQVMSLSKKLFNVRVIGQKGITQMAGNTLADILTQNLNITIVPDASTGRSVVSMFGLGGEYVKVLMDGIPVASDNGIGNNIDITQINLEDVERVEIIEGSAGVLYGDNAVAGVINIITKRGVEGNHKWQIKSSVQEETIGGEYSIFDRGRHIQNIKVGNQIRPALSYALGASRNDYAGFYNGFQGRDYVNIQDNLVVNDGLRGTEWNPKEQLTFFGNLNMDVGKHKIFYKFQFFDEALTIYNRTVNGRLNSDTGLVSPTALDEDYNTQRVMNNLIVSGPVKGSTTYNITVSHQNQKRYFKQYVYNILQRGIESYTADGLNQSSDFVFSKGFVSNLMPKSDFFNALLGYEFTWQKGFDAIATGSFSSDVVENTLENYDFFATTDFNLTKKLSLYPGMRLVNNSQFGNKWVWSFSSTYDFSEASKLKLAVGSAFRAPNFTELFFYFVDANHNVRGNPDLNPEDGISVFLNADTTFKIIRDNPLKSTLTLFYYDIENKITSVIDSDEDGRALFTFGNVDIQKILGFSWTNSIGLNHWQAGLGLSYIGESTIVDETSDADFGYLWSLNLQSSLTYRFPRLKTSVSALLNYNGSTQNIVEGDDGPELGKTDNFTWVDASIRTNLFENFDITLGARNLLDIVTVDATDIPAGAHGVPGAGGRLFGNGRSYFLKLLYTLNFN